MMFRCFCLLALVLQGTAFGQSPTGALMAWRQQLTLTSENDNYAFTYSDHYYTNGLMLHYTKALKPTGSGLKRLFSAGLGQMVFTPYSFSQAYRKYLDRPFTGFLFARAAYSYFTAGGTLLQGTFTAGVVGTQAFGAELQRWHHRIWKLKYPYGWESQLRTGYGINLEAFIAQPLLQKGSPLAGVQLAGIGRLQAGCLLTQASTGLQLRMGAVQPLHQSAATDARVSWDAKAVPDEWYFFFEPLVSIQWHNATLQGVWGQQGGHAYTTRSAPFLYQHRLGFVAAPGRWTALFALTYKTKEAISMRSAENWGTASVGYRW